MASCTSPRSRQRDRLRVGFRQRREARDGAADPRRRRDRRAGLSAGRGVHGRTRRRRAAGSEVQPPRDARRSRDERQQPLVQRQHREPFVDADDGPRIGAAPRPASLVEPADESELLRLISDEFVKRNFDVRTFLRELALTRGTYQRSIDLPVETSPGEVMRRPAVSRCTQGGG